MSILLLLALLFCEGALSQPTSSAQASWSPSGSGATGSALHSPTLAASASPGLDSSSGSPTSTSAAAATGSPPASASSSASATATTCLSLSPLATASPAPGTPSSSLHASASGCASASAAASPPPSPSAQASGTLATASAGLGTPSSSLHASASGCASASRAGSATAPATASASPLATSGAASGSAAAATPSPAASSTPAPSAPASPSLAGSASPSAAPGTATGGATASLQGGSASPPASPSPAPTRCATASPSPLASSAAATASGAGGASHSASASPLDSPSAPASPSPLLGATRSASGAPSPSPLPCASATGSQRGSGSAGGTPSLPAGGGTATASPAPSSNAPSPSQAGGGETRSASACASATGGPATGSAQGSGCGTASAPATRCASACASASPLVTSAPHTVSWAASGSSAGTASASPRPSPSVTGSASRTVSDSATAGATSAPPTASQAGGTASAGAGSRSPSDSGSASPSGGGGGGGSGSARGSQSATAGSGTGTLPGSASGSASGSHSPLVSRSPSASPLPTSPHPTGSAAGSATPAPGTHSPSGRSSASPSTAGGGSRSVGGSQSASAAGGTATGQGSGSGCASSSHSPLASRCASASPLPTTPAPTASSADSPSLQPSASASASQSGTGGASGTAAASPSAPATLAPSRSGCATASISASLRASPSPAATSAPPSLSAGATPSPSAVATTAAGTGSASAQGSAQGSISPLRASASASGSPGGGSGSGTASTTAARSASASASEAPSPSSGGRAGGGGGGGGGSSSASASHSPSPSPSASPLPSLSPSPSPPASPSLPPSPSPSPSVTAGSIPATRSLTATPAPPFFPLPALSRLFAPAAASGGGLAYGTAVHAVAGGALGGCWGRPLAAAGAALLGTCSGAFPLRASQLPPALAGALAPLLAGGALNASWGGSGGTWGDAAAAALAAAWGRSAPAAAAAPCASLALGLDVVALASNAGTAAARGCEALAPLQLGSELGNGSAASNGTVLVTRVLPHEAVALHLDLWALRVSGGEAGGAVPLQRGALQAASGGARATYFVANGAGEAPAQAPLPYRAGLPAGSPGFNPYDGAGITGLEVGVVEVAWRLVGAATAEAAAEAGEGSSAEAAAAASAPHLHTLLLASAPGSAALAIPAGALRAGHVYFAWAERVSLATAFAGSLGAVAADTYVGGAAGGALRGALIYVASPPLAPALRTAPAGAGTALLTQFQVLASARASAARADGEPPLARAAEFLLAHLPLAPQQRDAAAELAQGSAALSAQARAALGAGLQAPAASAPPPWFAELLALTGALAALPAAPGHPALTPSAALAGLGDVSALLLHGSAALASVAQPPLPPAPLTLYPYANLTCSAGAAAALEPPPPAALALGSNAWPGSPLAPPQRGRNASFSLTLPSLPCLPDEGARVALLLYAVDSEGSVSGGRALLTLLPPLTAAGRASPAAVAGLVAAVSAAALQPAQLAGNPHGSLLTIGSLGALMEPQDGAAAAAGSANASAGGGAAALAATQALTGQLVGSVGACLTAILGSPSAAEGGNSSSSSSAGSFSSGNSSTRLFSLAANGTLLASAPASAAAAAALASDSRPPLDDATVGSAAGALGALTASAQALSPQAAQQAAATLASVLTLALPVSVLVGAVGGGGGGAAAAAGQQAASAPPAFPPASAALALRVMGNLVAANGSAEAAAASMGLAAPLSAAMVRGSASAEASFGGGGGSGGGGGAEGCSSAALTLFAARLPDAAAPGASQQAFAAAPTASLPRCAATAQQQQQLPPPLPPPAFLIPPATLAALAARSGGAQLHASVLQWGRSPVPETAGALAGLGYGLAGSRDLSLAARPGLDSPVVSVALHSARGGAQEVAGVPAPLVVRLPLRGGAGSAGSNAGAFVAAHPQLLYSAVCPGPALVNSESLAAAEAAGGRGVGNLTAVARHGSSSSASWEVQLPLASVTSVLLKGVLVYTASSGASAWGGLGAAAPAPPPPTYRDLPAPVYTYSVDCGAVSGARNLTCGPGAYGARVDFRCPALYAAPRCVWWDASAGAYSSSGCTALPASDAAASVSCACSHLTDFAVRFGALAQEQANVFGSDNPAYANPAALLAYPYLLVTLACVSVFLLAAGAVTAHLDAVYAARFFYALLGSAEVLAIFKLEIARGRRVVVDAFLDGPAALAPLLAARSGDGGEGAAAAAAEEEAEADPLQLVRPIEDFYEPAKLPDLAAAVAAEEEDARASLGSSADARGAAALGLEPHVGRARALRGWRQALIEATAGGVPLRLQRVAGEGGWCCSGSRSARVAPAGKAPAAAAAEDPATGALAQRLSRALYLGRILYLRALYLHPFLAPFTLYSPTQPRLLRLALVSTSLLSQLLLSCVFYAFQNPRGGVGVGRNDGSAAADGQLPASLSVSAIGASVLVAAVQLAADAALGALGGAAMRVSFAYRYPTLAEEMARLQGAEAAAARALAARRARLRKGAAGEDSVQGTLQGVMEGLAEGEAQRVTACTYYAVNAGVLALLASYCAFALFYTVAFALAQPAGEVGLRVVSSWAASVALMLVTFPLVDLAGLAVAMVLLPGLGALAGVPLVGAAAELVNQALGGYFLASVTGVLGAFEGTLSGRLGNIVLLRAVARVQGVRESHLIVANAFAAIVARDEGARRRARARARAAGVGEAEGDGDGEGVSALLQAAYVRWRLGRVEEARGRAARGAPRWVRGGRGGQAWAVVWEEREGRG